MINWAKLKQNWHKHKEFSAHGMFYGEFSHTNDHLILKKETIVFIYVTTSMV